MQQQVYVSVGFTLFVIFFLVHMLTCVFYLIGKSDQVLPNGVVINGWVLGLTSEGEMWDSKLPDPGTTPSTAVRLGRLNHAGGLCLFPFGHSYSEASTAAILLCPSIPLPS